MEPSTGRPHGPCFPVLGQGRARLIYGELERGVCRVLHLAAGPCQEGTGFLLLLRAIGQSGSVAGVWLGPLAPLCPGQESWQRDSSWDSGGVCVCVCVLAYKGDAQKENRVRHMHFKLVMVSCLKSFAGCVLT